MPGAAEKSMPSKAAVATVDVKPIFRADVKRASPAPSSGVKRARAADTAVAIDLTGTNESAGEGRVHCRFFLVSRGLYSAPCCALLIQRSI